MLLTTGERVSTALLTMALADLGIDAISFTGSQVGIITDTVHGKAKIVEVKGDRVREALAAGQGRASSPASRASAPTRRSRRSAVAAATLTAVALAAGARAPTRCEIYTDVTGVFTADPRIVPQARKLAHVHFDEMLEMAGAGSKVLALRSVEFARNHNVPLHVRSSFTWEPGTWITSRGAEHGRPDHLRCRHRHVASPRSRSSRVPDRPGISAALFEPLADANVNVDMIVQNTSKDGTTDISFTMPKADMRVAEAIVARVAQRDRRRGRHARRRTSPRSASSAPA